MIERRDFIIAFESRRLGYGKVVLDNSSKGGIYRGVTAVVGRNGSGKSTLGNIIAKGRYAYGNRLDFKDNISSVKMLTFTDIHSFTGVDVQYYHQRMEATANDYVPTVGEIFSKKLDSPLWRKYSEVFRLNDINYKKINYLSSGELRKILIINALCDNPDLLILDNPYIGLDADARDDFDEAMKFMREGGVSIVFLLCDPEDVPDYVDSIIEMNDCKIGYPITDKVKITIFLNKDKGSCRTYDIDLPHKLTKRNYDNCDIVFSINDGHARYGDKTVFEKFNWIVNRGECWALKGRNGSGKSLLLSMVCADNPQGYANDIILFDRKRGSGESIWEIKDAIGYVCPEMQLYFKSNDSVEEIIIQGMRNSINRYRKSTPEEREIVGEWMKILEIGHLSDRKFSDLSSGEQRIVLLAGALAKQPELLVLDEPLHGLDRNYKNIVMGVISKLIENNGSTLIYVSHYSKEIPECVNKVKDIGRRI
ncbi:MAG: ATP-binding cassette domain-containing protein [Muribaculaceae bacterium]|nr:ATP-binding cassette domain-containing protein [Muribaculaceae bacterium]